MRIFKAALGAMVISVGLGLGGAAKAEMARKKISSIRPCRPGRLRL